jgi:plasmid stability protein
MTGGCEMANLQIKNIDDDFYKKIKALADAENRSVSQQVIFLVKDYLLKRQTISKIKTPAQMLLDISGSWDEDVEADEIIARIKRHRSNSKKLEQGF